MATENEKIEVPKARTSLEKSLGFRVDVRPDGEAGSVIWFTTQDRRSGVRPATGVEIRLWNELQRVHPAGEDYEPTEAENPDW